jgi:glycosyltransferase involved in cell wall biosynthesis
MSFEPDPATAEEERFLSGGAQQSFSGDQVGIALVPTDTPTDAVARALLRAEEREYSSVLVQTPTLGDQAIKFAQHLDVPVVEPPSEMGDSAGYRTTVEIAAQTAELGRVVLHDDITESIDYERTERVLEEEDGFLVEAVPESRPNATQTVAAIPAYNESARIGEVIEATEPYVDEVLVVDDGSEDDTAAVADAAGATVVEHERNQGYGAALNTTFTTAAEWNADQLVILDGDGQHEPTDIPRLLGRLDETDTEVVIGSRLTEDGETDMPLYRRCGLGVVNVLTNLSFGVTNRTQWVGDTQSGFRAYDRPAIESLAADRSISSGMDASTDILHHSHTQDYDIDEVGTTIYYDVEAGSSQGPVSHGLKLVSNLLTTIERDRPVLFLGLPGFLLTLVGVLIGYLTFSNYISTETFPLGLALVSSVMFLTGLFMGLTATMLHALKQYLGSNLEDSPR